MNNQWKRNIFQKREEKLEILEKKKNILNHYERFFESKKKNFKSPYSTGLEDNGKKIYFKKGKKS